MNHVYFDKRKLYLAVLCHCLKEANDKIISVTSSVDHKKSNNKKKNSHKIAATETATAAADSALFGEISFASFKGDIRKPIILLTPPFSSEIVIRLIPVVR